MVFAWYPRRLARSSAELPGTLVSRKSPRVPERATELAPSTVTVTSGSGSPLFSSTIVPAMVPACAHTVEAKARLPRSRRERTVYKTVYDPWAKLVWRIPPPCGRVATTMVRAMRGPGGLKHGANKPGVQRDGDWRRVEDTEKPGRQLPPTERDAGGRHGASRQLPIHVIAIATIHVAPLVARCRACSQTP